MKNIFFLLLRENSRLIMFRIPFTRWWENSKETVIRELSNFHRRKNRPKRKKKMLILKRPDEISLYEEPIKTARPSSISLFLFKRVNIPRVVFIAGILLALITFVCMLIITVSFAQRGYSPRDTNEINKPDTDRQGNSN